VAVAACTAAPQAAERPAAERHTTGVRPDGRAAPSGAPVLLPELDTGLGESVAGQQPPTRGHATFAYSAGPRGKVLIVAVSCRGEGRITVRMREMRTAFRHICTAGEPYVEHSKLDLASAHQAGTVSVSAPPTVTWAMTVGRGEASVEDLA
jgi:hypothetical protein